ncbi:MAG: S8 family serine peptidase, partial [Chloroflexi bacterium]|nr:S8 family serine peptidase [Chloroflexota bacterium]
MPIRASALPRVPPLFAHLALVVALIAIAVSAVPHARAADPGRPGRADELLVRYRSTSTPAQRREVARLYGLTGLGADASGRTEVVVAPGRSPAAVERKLRADPAILAVAPNHRRELALDPSAEPEIGEEWGMRNTGQRIVGIEDVAGSSGVDIDGLEALRYGVGSSNVVVAVIDDGIDFNHPDLGQRAWTNPGEAGALGANGIDDDGNGYIDDVNGWDFCNDDNTVHDPGEDGHGTHVAGTIAASLDGQGVVGVAPGVRLMALKFIDDSVQCGLDSMAVEAIDYAASFGIRIINASWGGEAPSTVIDAAIASSGALFVAAAGNDGRDLDRSDGYRFYPASSNLANVISVAAIDQTGHLAEFSNYGRRSVDLAAPGTNILSTWPADGDCSAWCYAWNAGTSMAAPHVSGAAALVASHRPSLLVDPIGLRARLMARGRTMPATAGLTVTGRMLNVLRVID